MCQRIRPTDGTGSPMAAQEIDVRYAGSVSHGFSVWSLAYRCSDTFVIATDQFSLIAAPFYMPVHIYDGPTARSRNVPKFCIGRIRYILQRTAPKSVHKPIKQRVVL